MDAPEGAGEETVLLLPAFDPYVVGAPRGEDAVLAPEHRARVSRPQGWISPTLVVNGRIEGVWEPSAEGPRVSAFGKVSDATRRALPPDATIV